jgi:hypothetical protein
MSKVTIILTDGSKSYKYYWLKQTSQGIYHGFFSDKKDNTHFSYHLDGKSHLRAGRDEQMVNSQEPLSNIRDVKELINIAHPPRINLSEFGRVVYRQEKFDNAIWIDARCFPKNAPFSIKIYLVAPERLGTLIKQVDRKNKRDYHLIQIINSINPWVVVHVSSTEFLRDFLEKITQNSQNQNSTVSS